MPPKRRKRESASAISATLREIIAGRGLTSYALAQAADVNPSVVSRFLRRERGLTLETFEAIAGALGLKLVETGRGKPRPSSHPRPDPRSNAGRESNRESNADAIRATGEPGETCGGNPGSNSRNSAL